MPHLAKNRKPNSDRKNSLSFEVYSQEKKVQKANVMQIYLEVKSLEDCAQIFDSIQFLSRNLIRFESGFDAVRVDGHIARKTDVK